MEQEHSTPKSSTSEKQGQSYKYRSSISFWEKSRIVIVSFLSFLVLLLLFINWHDIELDLVTRNISIPLPLMIIVSFFIGYLWGSIVKHRKQRKKERSSKIHEQKNDL